MPKLLTILTVILLLISCNNPPEPEPQFDLTPKQKEYAKSLSDSPSLPVTAKWLDPLTLQLTMDREHVKSAANREVIEQVAEMTAITGKRQIGKDICVRIVDAKKFQVVLVCSNTLEHFRTQPPSKLN